MIKIRKPKIKKRTLPALSEEYNKKYYLKNTAALGKLLVKSKYTILHRPYFSMINSTHEAVTVNPHTKIAVDAAPISEPLITLEEFLALFDSCN